MMKLLVAGAAGIALAMPVALPAVASSNSEDEAKTQGMCSGTARWELKAEQDDNGVKVEFAVDSHVPGETWDYSLSGPGGVLASGSATTDREGEFEVKALTSGSVTDVFSGLATTADQTCDSTDGVMADDRDDDSEDIDEGKCTADSSIELAVKQSGKKRVAKLSVTGGKKGQKWRYSIKRGNKVIRKGAARTKGRQATFRVKAKTKRRGLLTADATRSNGSEDCTTDDRYDDRYDD
jgi:hypothetical protein